MIWQKKWPLVLVFVGASNCFFPLWAFATDESRLIRMVVGEQKTLQFTNIDKVIIGNTRVADAKKVNENTFVLFAVEAGRTNMTVRRIGAPSVSYSIIVTAVDVKSLISEVQKLLGDREGINVRPVGDRVIIDGRAITTEDYRRVQEVAAMYPQVKSFVAINPHAKKLVADQLNLELKKAGLKNVEATVVGTKIFLEGSVESNADLQKAELVTKAIGEEVENLLTVGIKRMVLVEIDFVEIKKSGTDHIGIRWPLDIEGNFNLTFNSTIDMDTGHVHNSPLFIEATGGTKFGFGFLFQDGYARILAQPKLVCASGAKANFWSGGEVPIVVITAYTVSVEYKPFGVILEMTPTADRQGNIQMDIRAEVSDLDWSIGFVTEEIHIPGFVHDEVKTNVTVQHGQTIILGNLFHWAEQKDVTKIPLLGHIPIIGELFKSRVFTEKKAEICVFVTPQIVNPETPKILKMVADIKSRYQRAKSEVGFGIFD